MDEQRTIEQVRMDPIFRAFNPEGKHFLEARFLPPALNQYADRPINVAALTLLGYPHLKAIPAFQMMLEDFTAGCYWGQHTLVIDGSGNTTHAVARLAPAFGFKKVTGVVPGDIPESKRGILAALSTIKIMSPDGNQTAAELAIEEAQKPGHVRLNQYAHPGNARAHELYTGPQVLRALDGNVGIIAVAMGSAGTVTGVGRFLKKHNPDIIVLGVCPKLDEAVPGARDRKKMAEVVTLPWGEVVDVVVEVSRKDSFIGTRMLWSVVEPQPGPTSGLAWRGLIQYLDMLDPEELERLRGKNAAFLCPDDGRFYPERVGGELSPSQGLK